MTRPRRSESAQDRGRGPDPLPFGGRRRQVHAGAPLTREEFERWAGAKVEKKSRGIVFPLYQRLCQQLTSEERLQLSLLVDRLYRERKKEDEVAYLAVVGQVRKRLYP